jgi:uncharacterized membrane protein
VRARIIRIKKEARAIFWPWLAIVIAGALPALLPHSSAAAKVNVLCFFFGIPLLATLPLGYEFYHHTFSLWLTQPSSRLELWAEKMSVMVGAVLTAGFVSGFGMFSFALPSMGLTYNKAAAVAFVIITMASASFWTLATRSSIGGFLLISSIFWFFYQFGDEIRSLPRQGAGLTAVSTPAATIVASSVFAICFSAVMLWLGARKLVRFQVTGVTSGEDLLMSGPAVMPEAWAEWFRCRRSGASLNLIRKEFRLLRPVWLIELFVLPYLACLAVFRLLPAPAVPFPRTAPEWAVLGPPWMVCIGLAGLGGILSLGEERRSGTQAWHMTLPISARRQWLIKLALAILSGLACSLLLPLLTVIACGSIFGSPFMFVYRPFLTAWFILYPILIFACFWCACAANGTVRAVVWLFPATAAILVARSGGVWLGEELARTTGTLSDFVVSSFHLNPLAVADLAGLARGEVLWLVVPTLLFALLQSYRLFRAQPQDSVVWMLRCLLPLVAVTVLWSFSAYAGLVSSNWQPFEETRRALDTLQSRRAKLEIAGEELAKRSSLTAHTRRWLEGSSIAVAPDFSHSSGYLATIHLASGRECKLTVAHYGGTAAACRN